MIPYDNSCLLKNRKPEENPIYLEDVIHHPIIYSNFPLGLIKSISQTEKC